MRLAGYVDRVVTVLAPVDETFRNALVVSLGTIEYFRPLFYALVAFPKKWP